jgi:iron complex transport system substrate-binding protein
MIPITALLTGLVLTVASAVAAQTRTITDEAGRTLTIPATVDKVICSGAGSLRLLTYLGAHDRIVAVDGIEVRGSPIDVRPYAIANRQFKEYPIFGEFRGRDNPELIAALDPRPQVIFKTRSGQTHSLEILQRKTGIPVIALRGTSLDRGRNELYVTLRLMADIVGARQRCEDVIAYIESTLEDVQKRTKGTPARTCYLGGLGQSGPHGIRSTDPSYPPFEYLGLTNVAATGTGPTPPSYLNVAKEQLILWDPEFIFIDISTLRLGSAGNALEQLRNDPALRGLRALKNNQVYGLFPNNSYNQNMEVVLANSYFVGKTVFPESFSDVDPFGKAEEIATFFNGGPAFAQMNKTLDNMGFSRIKAR